MSSTYRIERDRGVKEYRQQLTELRKKWPLAFPVHDEDVRPLAVDAAHEIAAVMDWSYPYTLGVLSRWKMAPLYCQAVLCHDQRIALDGSPAEMVEPKAKDLATKHLLLFPKSRSRPWQPPYPRRDRDTLPAKSWRQRRANVIAVAIIALVRPRIVQRFAAF